MGAFSDYANIPNNNKRGGGTGEHTPYFYFKDKGGGRCIKRLYLGRQWIGKRFDIGDDGGLIAVTSGGLKVNNQGFIELGKMTREQVVEIASGCGLEVREHKG